jgi:DNA-3-methyladenine glycosylase II
MMIEIPIEGPLDAARTLARFHLWGEDPCNRLIDGLLLRAIQVDGSWHGYALRCSGPVDRARLSLSAPGTRSRGVLEAAAAEAARLFGLDQDVAGFYGKVSDDPVLGPLIPRLYGLRATLSPQPLEMLIGSICAQQVNLPFAFAVRARLVRRFGTPVSVGRHTVYGFPEAERLARARVSDLRRMQFTTRKAEYVVGLAKQVASRALDLGALASSSNDEVVEALTAVRGFGRWTAEWFLARHLGRGDVCTAGDLGVRRAFEHFYGRGREMTEESIRRRSAAWGPHQNLAMHYLLAGRRLALVAA